MRGFVKMMRSMRSHARMLHGWSLVPVDLQVAENVACFRFFTSLVNCKDFRNGHTLEGMKCVVNQHWFCASASSEVDVSMDESENDSTDEGSDDDHYELELTQRAVNDLTGLGFSMEVIEGFQEEKRLVHMLNADFYELEQFLRMLNKMGLKDIDKIGKILIGAPHLLELDRYEVRKRIKKFVNLMTFTPSDFLDLMAVNPFLIAVEPERIDRMFTRFTDIGLRIKDIRRILIYHPYLFNNETEYYLRRVLHWLVHDLEVAGRKLEKIIRTIPRIMLNTKAQLDEIWEFLAEDLKIGRKQVVWMVKKNPRFLEYPLEDGILPTTMSMKKHFGLELPMIGKFASDHPGILSRTSIEIQEARELLQDLGIDDKGANKIICEYPTMFMLSLDYSLKPKLQFFKTVLKRGGRDLVEFPFYMSYSIEEIMLRSNFLGPDSRVNVPLKAILKCGDDKFAENVCRVSLNTYLQYKRFWAIPKEWNVYVRQPPRGFDFESEFEEQFRMLRKRKGVKFVALGDVGKVYK